MVFLIEEFGEGGGEVVGAHEGFADEHGVEAGFGEAPDMVAGLYAAFADDGGGLADVRKQF